MIQKHFKVLIFEAGINLHCTKLQNLLFLKISGYAVTGFRIGGIKECKLITQSI